MSSSDERLNRQLLEVAGYVWNDADECWVHPQADRALDGAVMLVMSPGQIAAWILNGQKSD